MTSRNPARVDTARAGVALNRVINETRRLFHHLKRAAEQLHATERLRAGERGVLMELAARGPRTVPEMARARPVSRQHMQTHCNSLFDQALVEFAPNPRHRTSRLVQLTRAGENLVRTIKAREAQTLAVLSRGLDPADLTQAAETLVRVRQQFAGHVFETAV